MSKVCESVVLATAVAIAVAMHMETSFVLRKAVVGMTGVVAMSQVCGWAAGRVPRLSGGASLVTRLWPTLYQPLAYSGPYLGNINGTATIYARPTLEPCMAHY